MTITINNQPTETNATTLFALATELQLPQKGIAVAIANKIVPRNEWETTPLHDNDNIVIIKAACGG